MVLGLVSCPAKIHFTAVFALQNGKFSRLAVAHSPYPLSFVRVDLNLPKRSLVTGKDVSPIVEQGFGMTCLTKISRHLLCIASK